MKNTILVALVITLGLLAISAAPKPKPEKIESYIAYAEIDVAQKHSKPFQVLDGQGGPGETLLKAAEIQRRKGLDLKKQASKEGIGDEENANLLKKAVEAFEIAIPQYDKVRKQLKEKCEKIKADKKASKKKKHDIRVSYGMAWLQMMWTKQMKAEIMPEGASRTNLLKGLIKELDGDFGPEFMDLGLEFYGGWLEGVCHWNIAQYKKAITCCDGVLEELKAKRLLDDLEDVVRKICLLKADVETDWAVVDKENSDKHYLGAIKAIGDLFRQFPKIEHPRNDQDLSFYCDCLLKQAKAYAGLKRYGKAFAKASWVFENGTAGWKNLVSGLVEDEEWLGQADTAIAHFMTARKHMIVKAYEQALSSYKKGLAKASEDEAVRYGGTAWNHMGMCHYNLKRFYEAACAFEKLSTLGKKYEKEGLSLRVTALGKQYYTSKNASDSKLWLDSMLVFEDKYPEEKPDFPYLIGDRLRILGDLDKAIEWYVKTREKSQYYAKAQFRIPIVFWQKYNAVCDQEDPDLTKIGLVLIATERHFKEYLKWNGKACEEEDDEEARIDLVKKAATVEELYDYIRPLRHTDIETVFDPANRPALSLWMGKSLLALKKYKRAAAIYEKFLSEFKESNFIKKGDLQEAWYSLAICYRNLKRYDKEIEYLRKYAVAVEDTNKKTDVKRQIEDALHQKALTQKPSKKQRTRHHRRSKTRRSEDYELFPKKKQSTDRRAKTDQQ